MMINNLKQTAFVIKNKHPTQPNCATKVSASCLHNHSKYLITNAE